MSREHFASFVQSMMVAPRKYHFSQKSISNVKVKAAEFLTKKFGVLHDDPGQTVLLPRVWAKLSDNQVATIKFVWMHGSHQLNFTIWAFHQWKHLLIHRGVGSIKGLGGGGGRLFARALLDKIGCLKVKWKNFDVEMPQLIN